MKGNEGITLESIFVADYSRIVVVFYENVVTNQITFVQKLYTTPSQFFILRLRKDA